MTLERRQFISSSLIGENGLDRELSVDTSLETLRVHTASNPGGIPLASKGDVNTINNNISSLSDSVAGSVNNLQQQIDSLEQSISGPVSHVGLINNHTTTASWQPTTDPAIASVYPYSANTIYSIVDCDNMYPLIDVTVKFSPSDLMTGNLAPFCGFGVFSKNGIYTNIYSKQPMDLDYFIITCHLGSPDSLPIVEGNYEKPLTIVYKTGIYDASRQELALKPEASLDTAVANGRVSESRLAKSRGTWTIDSPTVEYTGSFINELFVYYSGAIICTSNLILAGVETNPLVNSKLPEGSEIVITSQDFIYRINP